MAETRFTLRQEVDLNNALKSIAEEEEKSVNDVVNDAVRYYRDYYYATKKATFLSDEILAAMDGMVNGLDQRINAKSNQLLSSIAIQLFVIQRILTENLEVSEISVHDWTAEALEFLRRNNRVLRLDENV